MKILHFLILSIILFTAYSAKFNIASTSSCTSTSAAGFCTKWEQNGTVEQQTASCFTGDMIVLTKNGYKKMSQLLIGDQILSYDRQNGQIYTKIRGWFHRDLDSNVQYLKVTFANGQTLKVSQKHNIAFVGEDLKHQFKFASDISTEQELYGFNKNVKNLQFVKQTGMYAPMTYNNNYFVFSSKNTNNSRILAHDFANIKNPQSYQPFVNIILSGYEKFSNTPTESGVHPAAKWLMNKFDFLLE